MATHLQGFDFADVVDEAVSLSGGESGTAQDVVSARRILVLLLTEWENEGFNTWRIKNMSAGGMGPFIGLSDDVSDVIQVNVRTQLSQTSGSMSPMTRIGAHQYSMLVDKTISGMPAQWYLDREEPPRLFVYPIGRSGATEQFSVTYVSTPADFDRYGNDIDAPSRWLPAVVNGIAHELSMRRPGVSDSRIAMLQGKAGQSLRNALAADRQRVGYRPRFDMGFRRCAR